MPMLPFVFSASTFLLFEETWHVQFFQKTMVDIFFAFVFRPQPYWMLPMLTVKQKQGCICVHRMYKWIWVVFGGGWGVRVFPVCAVFFTNIRGGGCYAF